MHSIAERKKHKKHQKWLKNAHKMSLQNNEKYKQHKYNQFKLALARHAQDKHKYNQFKMALARHAISVEDTSISTPISYITPPKDVREYLENNSKRATIFYPSNKHSISTRTPSIVRDDQDALNGDGFALQLNDRPVLEEQNVLDDHDVTLRKETVDLNDSDNTSLVANEAIDIELFVKKNNGKKK
eukprot:362661_1